MIRRPEQALQRAVAEKLALLYPPGRSRVTWLHPPNGGWRRKVEAAILKAMGAQPGASDLLFLWGTGAAAIELKAEGGRLSPAQRDFRAWCELAGIPWSECRSLGEVEDVLRVLVRDGMPEPDSWRLSRARRPSAQLEWPSVPPAPNNPPPPRVL